MASKDQPAGLDLAEINTASGKAFVDPFAVEAIYDYSEGMARLISDGVSPPTSKGMARLIKSALVIPGVPDLCLMMSAQEAFGILNEAAKAIQARSEE